MPPDVRWRLCPTGGEVQNFPGLRPRKGAARIRVVASGKSQTFRTSDG